MNSCVVIGAGLSGLAAARRLSDANIRVTVLERAEKVGGRMRTDVVGGGVFDHGAQFFTARDDRFEALVNGWISSGVAAEWTRGFADASGEQQEDGYPRYKGTTGMGGITEHLARGLDVLTGSGADRIGADPEKGWEVAAGNYTHHADALVLAVPAPDALDLLVDRSGVPLPDGSREALEGIEYEPCIAVMALLDDAGAVPDPGGVQIGGDTLFWVADNRKKGISDVPAITVHANAGWSREHAADDDDTVTQLLLKEAEEYLGGAGVKATSVYRWEHSWVTAPHDGEVYVEGPPPLVFCGDAYAGAKVEGATLSGLAAAERLLGVR